MKGDNNPVRKMTKERYKEVYVNFYTNVGDKNPMYGKKHDVDTLEMIGEKSKDNWQNQRDLMISRIKKGMSSLEVRKKLSDSRKNSVIRHKWNCPVCDKELLLTEAQINKKSTCSHSCSNKHRYNHKVVSLEFCGYEDVYDMTVEETHNFAVITSGKDDRYVHSSGIFIHNCAEQSLANHETCCLAEVYLPNIDSYVELKEALMYAYLMNKHSLALHCSLKETEAIVNKNMRMGIGMTGILQATEEQRSWLNEAYVWLRGYDEWYSGEHGFPESIKLTKVKPSGTLSLLAGVTP
jgi:transcription elongation factor Elf1